MKFKQHTFKAMGGPVDVKLYGATQSLLVEACKGIEDEVFRLEKKYSRYRDDSIATAINHTAKEGGKISVDTETASLLNYANVAHQQSDGLFDITSGVLREIWDFKTLTSPPAEQSIKALLERVGWHHVSWAGSELSFQKKEMELDFGGYVKEYAADCAAGVCRQMGVLSGVLNLAGDIVILGPKPDESPWEIGIRHPRAPESAYALVAMNAGAIATSGDYERFFIHEKTRYCHILNPKTGYPVQSMASVTVCADSCLVAGTASTITMLREEDGPDWIANLGLPYLLLNQKLEPSGTISAVQQPI
ncbi:MAG: FAD:protein FMN transferase [Gammaproteobacteria bacterium]|nr:FAD:protein FMN transferase [Gammaproteobacteria bacterium]